MKNKILIGGLIILSLTGNVFASSEDATLTDIKESLVYLIEKNDALDKKLNLTNGSMDASKKETTNNAEAIKKNTEAIEKIKQTLLVMQEKMDAIEKKIPVFEKTTISPDKYDEVIKNFIQKNTKGK
ncbi:hypothetical protein [Sulfurimonas indica]|uniref:hypothetical protein n=1 Tax=Sulfurimonas TaxID=202746 RepID=UPI001263A432|nr:hypothetical protein [Sulfurimonas indica]